MILLQRLRALDTEAPELNITSMVDMMAVLTIYLLATFATTDPNVRPLSDLTLPDSTTLKKVPTSTLKVSVSQTAMRLDNELVTTLHGGQVANDDMDAQQRIVPLMRALQRERERVASTYRMEGDLEPPQRDTLAIEAGHGLPYSAIDRVVRTATAAGFTQFHLAVNRKE